MGPINFQSNKAQCGLIPYGLALRERTGADIRDTYQHVSRPHCFAYLHVENMPWAPGPRLKG